MFFLADIVEYLETGIPQEQILVPKSKPHTATPGKKRGRPSKAEQMARRQADIFADAATAIPQEPNPAALPDRYSATPEKKHGRPTKAEQIARREAASMAREG